MGQFMNILYRQLSLLSRVLLNILNVILKRMYISYNSIRIVIDLSTAMTSLTLTFQFQLCEINSAESFNGEKDYCDRKW